MRPFFNLHTIMGCFIPTIAYGFPDDEPQWLSVLWLGMEAGVAWDRD